MGFRQYRLREINGFQWRSIRSGSGQAAIPVQGQVWRIRAFRVAHRFAAPSGNGPAQHLREGAGIGKVCPVRPSGGVKQDQRAIAARVGGDKRRAICESRPGLGCKFRSRTGENLLFDAHIARHGKAGKGRGFRKRRHGLGLVPGERAAERAR